MKIAIIGAGNVGRALGQGFAAHGHDVTYGLRDPAADKYAALPRRAPIAEAAAGADVVLLATPWGATADAIAACGPLAGKVLLDATNPIKGRLEGLEPSGSDSGGEQVARWASGARVVKVFNTTGFENMSNPVYGDQRSMMFVCGDDADAKAVARQLSDELGFETLDAGPLRNARFTEGFAMVWIWQAIFGGKGRQIAFTLARR